MSLADHCYFSTRHSICSIWAFGVPFIKMKKIFALKSLVLVGGFALPATYDLFVSEV